MIISWIKKKIMMDSYWEGYDQAKDKPTVTLNNWSVRGYPNCTPYMAPETIMHVLHGEAYGHPNHEDGKKIMTTEIVATKGNMVETKNTLYKLKEADVSYLLWCESEGITFDPKHPVKFVN